MAKLRRVTNFDKWEMEHMLGDKILELLVDTKKEELFHVDPPLGHIKAAAYYLGIDKSKINTQNASYLVSVLIKIEKGHVREIKVGKQTSLERAVKHSHSEIKKAINILASVMKLSQQLHEIVVDSDIQWDIAA